MMKHALHVQEWRMHLMVFFGTAFGGVGRNADLLEQSLSDQAAHMQ